MRLTQAELAEKVDLSVQHISRIESGCYIPSLKSFFMLVKVLHIDLTEFGFNMADTQNPLKNKLMEIIASATETELIFYDNMINALNKSFQKQKKFIMIIFSKTFYNSNILYLPCLLNFKLIFGFH